MIYQTLRENFSFSFLDSTPISGYPKDEAGLSSTGEVNSSVASRDSSIGSLSGWLLTGQSSWNSTIFTIGSSTKLLKLKNYHYLISHSLVINNMADGILQFVTSKDLLNDQRNWIHLHQSGIVRRVNGFDGAESAEIFAFPLKFAIFIERRLRETYDFTGLTSNCRSLFGLFILEPRGRQPLQELHTGKIQLHSWKLAFFTNSEIKMFKKTYHVEDEPERIASTFE